MYQQNGDYEYKTNMEETGVYCGNIAMTDIRVHFLYGDQITQPLTVTVGQTETKKRIPVFLSRQRQCDALLPVKEEGRLGVPDY